MKDIIDGELPTQSSAFQKNPLVLAYLGDSVFSFVVREYLVNKYEFKPNTLNKKANSVVCAVYQAKIMKEIKSELTQDEQNVVNRARNSHTNNKATNSTLEEYNLATQFEALLGYWHLTNQKEKIMEVFSKYVMEKL